MRERSELADLLVEIANFLWLLGRFAIRGTASIQCQDRDARLIQQLADVPSVHWLSAGSEHRVFEVYDALITVAIEMNRVKRLALRFGCAKPLGELLESWRPQDFQIERSAGRVTQSANELPRHGTEGHWIIVETADHEQDADVSGSRPWRAGNLGRPSVTAYERVDSQRERQIGHRIAHEFPGDQCIPDFSFDFDARLSEFAANARPDITAGQYLAEQLAPYFAHALLDTLGDRRGGMYWIDPVILQIPAEILRFLGGES
jgi:hypothetical protein